MLQYIMCFLTFHPDRSIRIVCVIPGVKGREVRMRCEHCGKSWVSARRYP